MHILQAILLNINYKLITSEVFGYLCHTQRVCNVMFYTRLNVTVP